MTIDQINKICQDTFISHLEIEFIEFTEEYVLAKMPVNRKKMQPMGILHGGASLALAETVAGAGTMLLIDSEKYVSFGLQVTGNHISTSSSGEVFAKAEIVHKGQSTHVWDVKISNPEGKLISISRVTNIIKEKV